MLITILLYLDLLYYLFSNQVKIKKNWGRAQKTYKQASFISDRERERDVNLINSFYHAIAKNFGQGSKTIIVFFNLQRGVILFIITIFPPGKYNHIGPRPNAPCLDVSPSPIFSNFGGSNSVGPYYDSYKVQTLNLT